MNYPSLYCKLSRSSRWLKRAFILPLSLILLLVSLSATVITTKLVQGQSTNSASALDSFVSLSYAKEALYQCEQHIFDPASGATRRDAIITRKNGWAGASDATPIWNQWKLGSLDIDEDGINLKPSGVDHKPNKAGGTDGLRENGKTNNTNNDNDMFRRYASSSISFGSKFKNMLLSTADANCLIDPVTISGSQAFVITVRAQIKSPSDLTQLQSIVFF